MSDQNRFDRAREGLTELVIGAAIEVHRHLGPGLLESAYEECLAWELIHCGAAVRRQVPLTLEYKGLRLDEVYRLDLLVEECVIVEVKTVDRLLPVHEAQVRTYLRLAPASVGLLLNFRTAQLRDGIRRVAL
jgi:GxxExxY protein